MDTGYRIIASSTLLIASLITNNSFALSKITRIKAPAQATANTLVKIKVLGTGQCSTHISFGDRTFSNLQNRILPHTYTHRYTRVGRYTIRIRASKNCQVSKNRRELTTTIQIIAKPGVNSLNPNQGKFIQPQAKGLNITAKKTKVVMCYGRIATIIGTNGNDNIVGTPGDDVIAGLDGNDRIDGRGGNDIICGNRGNDIINGGAGDDKILGGDGNDVINGESGRDLLKGGKGDDTITGGLDNDSLQGEDGHDKLIGDAGNDLLIGGDGNDSLYGSSGEDRLLGGNGNDILYGGPGNDQLYGANGDDRLFGESGNDHLAGYGGNDYCDGGIDSDTQVECEIKVNIP